MAAQARLSSRRLRWAISRYASANTPRVTLRSCDPFQLQKRGFTASAAAQKSTLSPSARRRLRRLEERESGKLEQQNTSGKPDSSSSSPSSHASPVSSSRSDKPEASEQSETERSSGSASDAAKAKKRRELEREAPSGAYSQAPAAKDAKEGVSKDALEKYAQQGSAVEQFELGRHYLYGTGGYDRDYDQARIWIAQSAAQGYIEAEALMGNLLLAGRVVKKDLKNAMRHFLRCASRGHVEAQASLGHMLLHGIGTDEDVEEALTWLRKAAKQGSYRAMRDMGFLYAEGKGSVSRDLHIASRLVEAVGQNAETIADAQRLAGTLHVAKEDTQQAKEWYRKAADGGDLEAMASLGQVIFRDQSCDSEEALEGARWLQKAADLGHKRAQRDLGFLFTDGRESLGIERNCKRGVFYLATAGLFGMPDAYFRAAEVLATGEPRYPGITVDMKLAKEHIKDARKTARENKLPTLGRQLWNKLFDDPTQVRTVIDNFENDENGKRVRIWFGGLQHLDPEANK